jgi:hypothetical protein
LFVGTEKTKVKNVESKQRKKSQIKTRDETHDDTYELQSQQMLHPMSSRKNNINLSSTF